MRQVIVDWFAHLLIASVRCAVVLSLPWTARTAAARWIGWFSTAEMLLYLGMISIIVLYLTIDLADRIPLREVEFIVGIVFVIQILAICFLRFTRFIWYRRRAVANHRPAAIGFASVVVREDFFSQTTQPVSDEFEILRTAVSLLTRLHPSMTRAHRASMRAEMASRIAALTADAALVDFPSAPEIGTIRRRRDPDHGHFFAYSPERDPGECLPLLLALHGHGGNPLIWLASWKPLADRLGLIVVSPSFGYGQWEHRDAASCLLKTVAAARELYSVNDRLYIAGISQGACGVTRAAAVLKPDGLIYMSPTMEAKRLEPATIPRVPVLVFQGGADVNVRPASVDEAVASLSSIGFDVEYHRIDKEDHFLRFRSQINVDDTISAWLAKHGAS